MISIDALRIRIRDQVRNSLSNKANLQNDITQLLNGYADQYGIDFSINIHDTHVMVVLNANEEFYNFKVMINDI